jgi:hypothetical protein
MELVPAEVIVARVIDPDRPGKPYVRLLFVGGSSHGTLQPVYTDRGAIPLTWSIPVRPPMSFDLSGRWHDDLPMSDTYRRWTLVLKSETVSARRVLVMGYGFGQPTDGMVLDALVRLATKQLDMYSDGPVD